ncbi:MAG TPA: hypothetical protein VF824_05560 [Thermoanaerobaculia bacterium]|jgi:hypothetical protein
MSSKRLLSMLFVLLFAAAAFGAQTVPLSTNLKFEKLPNARKDAITLLITPELSQLVVPKKMRLLRLEFPLGNAVAVNTENALRSAFGKVKIARSADDVETPLVLELTSMEVQPKLPLTTFGTYTSKVTLTYVLRDTKKHTERTITVHGDGGNKKNAGRVLWDTGWTWTEPQQLAKATDLATLDALDALLQDLTQ